MSDAIKPFVEQGHYTSVHDAVFDVVMPVCPPNAWKVLCFVLRRTRGWQNDSDTISYEQLRRGTGIGSKSTLSSALKWLARNRLIVRDTHRDKKGHQTTTTYSLNRHFEIGHPITETVIGPSTEIEQQPGTDVVPEPGSETVQTITISTDNHSRRGAIAPQINETEQKKNWFTILCDRLTEVGISITPEDRKTLPRNLISCQLKEDATETEMYALITHLVERRRAGVELSPQRALNDVRGVKATPKQEASTSSESPECVVRAFEEYDRDGVQDLRRIASVARQWDLTSDKPMPWPILHEISPDENERNTLLPRIKSVTNRAMKEANQYASTTS